MAAGLDDVIIVYTCPPPFVTDVAYEVMYRPNNHDFFHASVGIKLVSAFVVAYSYVAQER